MLLSLVQHLQLTSKLENRLLRSITISRSAAAEPTPHREIISVRRTASDVVWVEDEKSLSLVRDSTCYERGGLGRRGALEEPQKLLSKAR